MSSPSSDPLRVYLQEIGRYPMLTPEQEITCSRQVQQMMAIEERKAELTQQLHHEPTLAELAADVDKSETQLSNILHQGQQAKQKMMTANLRLVVAIAKKYQWCNLELLDLIQEGAIGLHKAVEKFDPNRGYRFSTCAYWWIRQAIMGAVAEKSRTVRLPLHLTDKLLQIKKIQREMATTHGRSATITEIAQALGTQPNQIWEYLGAFRPLVSLDVRIGEERDTELQEILPDENPSPDEFLIQEFFQQDFDKWLESLSPIQQQVLTLRFGLRSDCVDYSAQSNRKLTVKQIGERLNIPPSRVSYIQQQAMKILYSQQEQIRPYLAS
ncbi:RNA polymerase sigma factor, RpoD/SigA family [Nostocales cyanobacterium LEGE 11386]|nr:RNA polymerase sigma factor, RpoD/SigA family [Nostocales cyanobacterium LEGE 11386]